MESRKQAASRPKATVSKRGVRLYFTYIIQNYPRFLACFAKLLIKTEVVHTVHQRAPHQKLQGKIVNSFGHR